VKNMEQLYYNQEIDQIEKIILILLKINNLGKLFNLENSLKND
jgi:hypothetical protein